jgi:tetratricopeptide (TPR) repeat protein
MMLRGAAGLVLASVLAPGLILSAAGLQYLREQRYPQPAVTEESLTVTSGQAVRRLTTGYHPLAADLYWIRAIQHYGRTRISLTTGSQTPGVASQPYALLYPLLDLTTTLDPQFKIAYRFGAIFLSAPLPDGAGRPDLAVKLLEKGLQASPGKWEYLHDIGFVYYWDLHDFPKAAQFFNQAADAPSAPWWLRSLAAMVLARGGDRMASRLLWRQMYDTAPDDRGREAAALKLLQFDALDQIEELQERADTFADERGVPPRSWRELAEAGYVGGIPADPGGTPYELSESGRVTLSTQSTLLPLPMEPEPR